jgi:hypothetical protein
MTSQITTGPATPLDHATLSMLLAEVRRKRSPLRLVHELLPKIGCNEQAVTYVDNSPITRENQLERVFTCPSEDTRDIVREGLATACDIYAQRKRSDDKAVAVTLALAVDENWRTCLQPGHDPYALATNSILALRKVTEHQVGFSAAIINMLNQWLRAGHEPIVVEPYTFEWRWDRPELEETIIRSMFGDAWWVLYGPPEGKLIDLTTIMRERSAFLPGLAGSQQECVFDSEMLPEMF